MAKLNGTKMQPAEYVRNFWRVTLPVGIDYQELFVPSFWANVAAKLVRGDIIEVFVEDGSWYAQVIVRVQARTHAVVGELLFTDFSANVAAAEPTSPTPGAEPAGPAPTVEWKGPVHKYSVIRHDGEYLKDGFETKAEAQAWADENAESLV